MKSILLIPAVAAGALCAIAIPTIAALTDSPALTHQAAITQPVPGDSSRWFDQSPGTYRTGPSLRPAAPPVAARRATVPAAPAPPAPPGGGPAAPLDVSNPAPVLVPPAVMARPAVQAPDAAQQRVTQAPAPAPPASITAAPPVTGSPVLPTLIGAVTDTTATLTQRLTTSLGLLGG